MAGTFLGPSPRVRGSQGLRGGQHNSSGSIPAGAGEPVVYVGYIGCLGVHPRGCGGASRSRISDSGASGPSPRVRGSLLWRYNEKVPAGSIPAGAGEPQARPVARWLAGVHPRGCGGALVMSNALAFNYGPSPRVRGSLALATCACISTGSIPAGAGEPSTLGGNANNDKVHPRGCGGAPVPLASSAGVGSIPAGAGEPVPPRSVRPRKRVHPRGCGGASTSAVAATARTGPSPRVRGSLARERRGCAGQGSIPAGAGEPGSMRCFEALAWVHPRGCGGARIAADQMNRAGGPSPRVRGSPGAMERN